MFYGLVLAGTVGGAALTLVGVNPIKLLVFAAVINGVAAGPFLALLMLISSDRKLMGKYTNGKLARTFGWITTALMSAAAIILFAFGHGGGLY
jgi:Mn2+/Fe2+ NRAMP family transporter